MNLSPNFTLEELAFSSRAAQLGYNNEPNEQQIECLRQLAIEVLEPVRTYFRKPVVIDSGFRGPNLNRAIGGELHSQHLYGQAADIRIIGIGNDTIWSYIKDNIPFDQLILEHVKAESPRTGWVHVSYNLPLRRDAISCIAPRVYVPGLKYAA